jgi:hypothetical protein
MDEIKEIKDTESFAMIMRDIEKRLVAAVNHPESKHISEAKKLKALHFQFPNDASITNAYGSAIMSLGKTQQAHDLFLSVLDQERFAPSNYYLSCEYLGIPVSKRKSIKEFFPNIKQFKPKKYDHNKIHICYLTSDVSLHGNARLLFEVLKNHDKDKFDIFVLYNNVIYDAMTREIIKACPDIYDVTQSTADELFQKIDEMEIDVLVDTMGHTGGGPNLAIFAQHQTMICLTGFGFPGTTTLDCFDYRIGSDICTGFTEPIMNNKYGYSPLSFLPGVECKTVETKKIGCLSNPAKITIEDLRLHAEFMNERKNYTLEYCRSGGQYTEEFTKLILDTHKSYRNNNVSVVNSTDGERLYADMLLQYDAILDTATWNNHIIAMDALSFGIPTMRLSDNDSTCASCLSRDIVNQMHCEKYWLAGIDGKEFADMWTPLYSNAQSWNNIEWVREYERLITEAMKKKKSQL